MSRGKTPSGTEPDESVLRAYWRAFPDPYERGVEDSAAAKRHIRAIIRQIDKAQSAR